MLPPAIADDGGVSPSPYHPLRDGWSSASSRGPAAPAVGGFGATFSSAHSSTAATIQADLFCSSGHTTWTAPTKLFHFRVIAAAWLLSAAIWVPICELQGGACLVGHRRLEEDGELGTLSGEGQPNPDPSATPVSAHERTLWLLVSLSYIMSVLLGLYFLYLLFLAYRYRLLFKQCTSYPIESLSVISYSSTAAHPLTPSQKLAAVLFQLIVPTTIGMCLIYWSLILPHRLPPSWYVSVHLHLITGILAVVELCWNRFLFRPKALFYWTLMCLLYLLTMMTVYVLTHSWEYSSLNWTRSIGLSALTWICGCVFLGPVMFLICALIQYVRDGATRGIFTSAIDIGQASNTHQVEAGTSALVARGAYIRGALAQFALNAPPASGPQTPTRPSVSTHQTPAAPNGRARTASFDTTSNEELAHPPPSGVMGQIGGWLRSWWLSQP